MKITREMLDQRVVSECLSNQFTAYASDLGLKPGDEWPRIIRTDLGNGRRFVAHHKEKKGEDFLAVWYFQAGFSVDGPSLTLIND